GPDAVPPLSVPLEHAALCDSRHGHCSGMGLPVAGRTYSNRGRFRHLAKTLAGAVIMHRPQFRLRSLFILTALVAVGCLIGPPIWHRQWPSGSEIVLLTGCVVSWLALMAA